MDELGLQHLHADTDCYACQPPEGNRGVRILLGAQSCTLNGLLGSRGPVCDNSICIMLEQCFATQTPSPTENKGVDQTTPTHAPLIFVLFNFFKKLGIQYRKFGNQSRASCPLLTKSSVIKNIFKDMM